MAVVVDASALVLATTSASTAAVSLRSRFAEERCHAPHLIDAEYGSVLRRMVSAGQLTVDVATGLLEVGPGLIDERYEHRGALAFGAWALRERVTFYDGAYVALAALLRLPLVTAHRRLAAVSGLPCEVEVPAR